MTSPDLSSSQSLSQPRSQIDHHTNLVHFLFRDFGPQGVRATYGVTSDWIAEVESPAILRYLYYMFEAANELSRAGYPEFSNTAMIRFVNTETPHNLIKLYYHYIMEEAEAVLGHTSKDSRLEGTS